MRRLCILIVFNGYFFLSFAQACQLSVHIMEFQPLAIKNAEAQWSGLNVDYIKVLLEEANCQFSFIESPFARGLKLLEQGEVDMTVNISKTEPRKDIFHFIGPQRIESIRLVSRKGSLPLVSSWQEMNELEGTLIRQRGAYLGKEIEDVFNSNHNLDERLMLFTHNKKRIEMIKKGRADGFFIESTHLLHQLETNPDYQTIEVHPIIINREPVYYAFSKKTVTTEQLKLLKQAYEQLQETEKFKEIEQRYNQFQ